MSGDPVVEGLNRQLRGSPYSIADDFGAETQVREALDFGSQIQERHRTVEAEFTRRSREIQDRIGRMTQTRGVYESNALESAGLPLDQTERAIDAAGTDLDSLREHMAAMVLQGDRHLLEVLGLHAATLFAKDLAADYRDAAIPLREINIRQLHGITLPTESFAGSYREVEVKISGSVLETSDVLDVPFHMQQLLAWVNGENLLPPLAAAVAHSWLAMIHPFQDGNGRVARLLANVVLMQAGWPPLIIRASDRVQYLDALSLSDEAGDVLPLFDLFLTSIERVLGDLEEPGLAEQLYVADLKRDDDLRYDLWWTQLDEVLNRVRSVLRTKGWDMTRTEVPEPSTLQLLERRDKTGNLWLAKALGPSGQIVILRLGPMSEAMAEAGAFQDLWPSVRLAIPDDRPDVPHGFRDACEDPRFDIEELVVRPPVTPACVAIKRGVDLEDFTAPDGAAALAAHIIEAIGS